MVIMTDHAPQLPPDDTTCRELPQLLKPAEAAKLLRRSPRTLRNWEKDGRIRAVRIAGGRPLYELSELERVIAAGS
jgi:excisionase family DNA binding protein